MLARDPSRFTFIAKVLLQIEQLMGVFYMLQCNFRFVMTFCLYFKLSRYRSLLETHTAFHIMPQDSRRVMVRKKKYHLAGSYLPWTKLQKVEKNVKLCYSDKRSTLPQPSTVQFVKNCSSVSSMIHSTRPTGHSLASSEHCSHFVLFWQILKSGNVRTVEMCENNYLYRP